MLITVSSTFSALPPPPTIPSLLIGNKNEHQYGSGSSALCSLFLSPIFRCENFGLGLNTTHLETEENAEEKKKKKKKPILPKSRNATPSADYLSNARGGFFNLSLPVLQVFGAEGGNLVREGKD
eukprot:TRINITY_DN10694_c0_g1_i1.p1 TRINITY_DN10694_c0_g1~~TRINITY_DN10694_c0_g1_i1.p1  ORF type:complete len:124 (+),score=11.05 TRINITY_DN10694_c0_g1_i1:210-581(+)